MDGSMAAREVEMMKSLGVFGVYKESWKLICSSRRNLKTLTFLTLSFLLPLSLVFLLHMHLSSLSTSKIINLTRETDQINDKHSESYHSFSHQLSIQWTIFWLIQLSYWAFLLLFSVLSTSTVVSAVASSYTAEPPTFQKAMTTVTKVWKRLTLTIMWTMGAFFTYNALAILVIVIIWTVTTGLETGWALVFVLVTLAILYIGGYVYLLAIWELASVVSVLELGVGGGAAAMMRSMRLMKGKTWTAMFVMFNLKLVFVVWDIFFVVRLHRSMDAVTWTKGSLTMLVSTLLCLFWLVSQTVLYFVCKSYHQHDDDQTRSDLSTLFEPIKPKLPEYQPSTQPTDQYHVNV